MVRRTYLRLKRWILLRLIRALVETEDPTNTMKFHWTVVATLALLTACVAGWEVDRRWKQKHDLAETSWQLQLDNRTTPVVYDELAGVRVQGDTIEPLVGEAVLRIADGTGAPVRTASSQADAETIRELRADLVELETQLRAALEHNEAQDRLHMSYEALVQRDPFYHNPKFEQMLEDTEFLNLDPLRRLPIQKMAQQLGVPFNDEDITWLLSRELQGDWKDQPYGEHQISAAVYALGPERFLEAWDWKIGNIREVSKTHDALYGANSWSQMMGPGWDDAVQAYDAYLAEHPITITTTKLPGFHEGKQ